MFEIPDIVYVVAFYVCILHLTLFNLKTI